MKRSSKGRQAGISFFGLIIVMIVLAAVGLVAAQALPSALEYQATVKAVERSKDAGTPPQIRVDFDKAASIDDIKSIRGRDLEITAVDGRNVVKFAYDKQIHMFGPAYLLLKYAYQTK
jgi:hypothetical protein